MSDDEQAARDERPLTDEERAELYRKQLKQLHVIDLVRDMMVTLVTVGYEKLGLTEQTRELRDLGDARVAIESLRRLIEVVEGEGDPEAASLRSTLAQMQLNFARAATAEPRPETAAPAPGAAPDRPPTAAPEQPPAAAPEQPPAAAAPEERSEADAHPRVEGENEPAMSPTRNGPAVTRQKSAAEKPAAGPKKPETRKPAAQKPAAKKPQKPAAKKPAPQKPAAKKPAARKRTPPS
jgi:hypothetical protein